MKKWLSAVILWLTLLFVPAPGGLAQAKDYRIGPGDALEIKFWQDPTLNALVRVGADGMIAMDVIGRIEAAGRTTEELQDDIVRQISRLNKKISQAVVVVTAYNYQYVFVTGQVKNPGKLSFEEIPDLWAIINEAGGMTEFGDLSRVTIIRGGKDAGKVEVVNVNEAIAGGRVDKLPKINREDTIEIGRMVGGAVAAEVGSPAEQRNVFYVVGAVTRPGPVTYQDDVDIMEALALAGGPSPTADLRKAKVVTKDGYFGQSLQFDLEKYAATGALPRYIMRREDTFIIPEHKAGFLGVGVGTIAAIVGVVSSAFIIYDQLKSDNNNTATAR
jgi:protein involved in polysaccharide export with SLBB domain